MPTTATATTRPTLHQEISDLVRRRGDVSHEQRRLLAWHLLCLDETIHRCGTLRYLACLVLAAATEAIAGDARITFSNSSNTAELTAPRSARADIQLAIGRIQVDARIQESWMAIRLRPGFQACDSDRLSLFGELARAGYDDGPVLAAGGLFVSCQQQVEGSRIHPWEDPLPLVVLPDHQLPADAMAAASAIAPGGGVHHSVAQRRLAEIFSAIGPMRHDG